MKRESFNTAYAGLLNAFPAQAERLTVETQELYWVTLNQIPEENFRAGMMKILTNNTYFPSIREIGVASMGERKRHTVTPNEDPWTRYPYQSGEDKTWRQILDQRLVEDQKKLEAGEQMKLPVPSPNSQKPVPSPQFQAERIKVLGNTMKKLNNKLDDSNKEKSTLMGQIVLLNQKITDLEAKIETHKLQDRKAFLRQQEEELKTRKKEETR